jgi:hypothetical protein
MSDRMIGRTVVGALVVLALTGSAFVVNALTDDDGSVVAARTGPSASASTSPTTEPTTTTVLPTPTPTPTPTPSPAPSKPVRPTRAAMGIFIRGYLASAPTDPASGWSRLTRNFQARSGGFAAYRKFWREIRSARVSRLGANTKAMIVAYDVDYTHRDGSHSSEPVRLRLVLEKGTFLIAGVD